MFKNILTAVIIIAGAGIYAMGGRVALPPSSSVGGMSPATMEEKVLPPAGVILPIRWGNLGKQMTAAGVIDREKFQQLYMSRGGLTAEIKSMLDGENNDEIRITPANAGAMLNLLWAFGLGSKNDILEAGPMADKKYGGDGPPAGGFASTGGWTLAKGDAMDHYSRHQFFNLTSDQQTLVERVSKGIYRPCCGNSTYFPDCNHGMAMLGLLELMAAQGVSEEEMYRTALAVNSYWFPDTYLTLATYMKNKGVDWSEVNPQEILGINYSSGQGFAKIASQVAAPSRSQGGGCGA
ncbi:MAG: hypothetical protein AAB415_00445 [Patescibacteria group bacterium]|mgnify:CR=1 FL=1